jgi:hypothetical protein
MICLPPLLIDGRQYLLPAEDRSALVLAELFLSDSADVEARDRLTAALAADPGLVLWTLLRCGQATVSDESGPPRTCASLAEWLVEHAEAALDWSGDFQPSVTLNAMADDLAAVLQVQDGPLRPLPTLLDELGVDVTGWAEELRSRVTDGQALNEQLGRVLPLLARRARRMRAIESRFDTALEQEKIESLAEFAAGAGHEINNPLTVISGRAQLLLRGEPDPERRHDLALISAQAMRVNEMIADMRLFARPPVPKTEAFDLTAMLDRLVEQFGADAARLEIAFRRRGRREPTPITADPAQVEVVLRAICRNAVEAIGHAGRVDLEIMTKADQDAPLQDGTVQVIIADDGPGITPEQRRHIFDPFYSARQAGRGLGLGLSKAWRIVTAHGGRIDVESEPGHGASFQITLPMEPPCPSAS